MFQDYHETTYCTINFEIALLLEEQILKQLDINFQCILRRLQSFSIFEYYLVLMVNLLE